MGSVADSVAAKIRIIIDNTNFLARKIMQKWISFDMFIEVSQVVQERAEGPKAPSPGQRPGYNSISARRPVRAKALLIACV